MLKNKIESAQKETSIINAGNYVDQQAILHIQYTASLDTDSFEQQIIALIPNSLSLHLRLNKYV